MTAAERGFDRLRHRLGAWGAPCVFFGLWYAPLGDISSEAQRMAAVLGLAIVLWISEAIPLAATALLAPSLAVLLEIAPAKSAYAAFADPLIFLFLGGFFLAKALTIHGCDRRAALWLLSRDLVQGSPRRAMMVTAIATFLVSMWLSNTATTAMMVPIAIGLCQAMDRNCLGDPQRVRVQARFNEGMLITLAYAASLGGICTPIGTAPNMIALGLLREVRGVSIDFLQWMSFACPAAVLSLVLALVIAWFRFPPPASHVAGLTQYARDELKALGAWQAPQRRSIAVFIITVAGWIAPSICRLFLGAEHATTLWTRNNLSESIVAILGATLLFAMPSGRTADAPGEEMSNSNSAIATKPLLTWEEAVDIDWGTLFLLGGGLAIGKMTFDTGLAEVIGRGVINGFAGSSEVHGGLIMLIAVALVLLMTEFTSNMATTSMMLPVLMPIFLARGLDPVPAVLCVALAASYAFMLPVSTPPNAIAYGTGRIRLMSMIVFGAWMDLVGFLVLAAIGWFLIPMLVSS
jgi:sodium-dependent dicarboxylate transporter 2/3/5